MKIKLDRTLCDGFMRCAEHAPETFSLDDWGYASLVGDGQIGETDEPGVRRALLDCPVHAILELRGRSEVEPARGAQSTEGEAAAVPPPTARPTS